jgi:hypothetical protein
MNQATQSRFVTIYVDYVCPEDETKLVSEGYPPGLIPTIELLTQKATLVRKLRKDQKIFFDFSTRHLKNIAMFLNA